MTLKKGNINPDWPYKDDNLDTPEDESTINDSTHWISNPKRTQRF